MGGVFFLSLAWALFVISSYILYWLPLHRTTIYFVISIMDKLLIFKLIKRSLRPQTASLDIFGCGDGERRGRVGMFLILMRNNK